MTIEADASAVIAAFDRFPDVAMRHLLPVAADTAHRIDTEATARVRRRTGQTAEGIVVQPNQDGTGSIVAATRNPYPNLPLWLDKGTVHMTAKPFFDVSARLEQPGHVRRSLDALQDAIDETGLGD